MSRGVVEQAMPRLHPILVALAALSVLLSAKWADGAPRQAVPTVQLSSSASLEEAFSEIAGVHELATGRVVVVDTRERLLKIADFELGTVVQLSRTGDGPGEHRAPLSIFGLPDRASVVFDGGATRLLFLDPNGRPGRTLSLAGVAASGSGLTSRFVPTRGDSLGRLYGNGPPVRVTPQGLALADSVPIVRWAPESETLTPVAHLRVRSLRDRGGDIDPERAVITPLIPFVVGDQWAVDQAGRIAILPYDVYRVDMVDEQGVRRVGPELRFEKLPLTEEHKAAWRREASSTRPATEPPRWPEFLPPFLNRPAQFAPDGLLWILRTGPADASPTYDVVNRDGRLIRRVMAPPRGRVIGFGTKSVYVSVRDDDDLQYLHKFPLP
jgi:hypothetical protein